MFFHIWETSFLDNVNFQFSWGGILHPLYQNNPLQVGLPLKQNIQQGFVFLVGGIVQIRGLTVYQAASRLITCIDNHR